MSHTIPTIFCQKLRAKRVAAGITQGDLAEITGIPRPVINAYENGRSVPKHAVALLLASLLGFSLVPDLHKMQRRLREISKARGGYRV